jgi:hypothetical protein
MHRINYNGSRLYLESDPIFNYYSGLTGAIEASTPKGNRDAKRLTTWKEDMIDSFGKKNAEIYVDLTAEFGTITHESLLIIKEKGEIDWNKEFDRAVIYFKNFFLQKGIAIDDKINSIIQKTGYSYQKHIASIMQFIHENVKEIYAIETPAKIDYLKICTPLDIVCLCKLTPKGEYFKTTINLKTSDKIGKHHLKQAACELLIWNETYPEDKATHTAILKSKDWNESKYPTYEFKYMTLKEAEELAIPIFKRMELCLGDPDSTYFPNPVSKYFTGICKIGEVPVIIEKTLETEWKEKLEELNKPPIDLINVI